MAAQGEIRGRRSVRAWGVALIVSGLLLFTWPFVRTPPLGLLGAYLHLFAAWIAVVVAIWVTARALGHREPDA